MRKICRYRQRFLIAVALCLFSSVWTVLSGGFDPYKTLGVSRSAPPDEIKKRYRKLCLQYHPDKNVSKPTKERELCETKFKQVQAAFDMIQNPQSTGPSMFPQSNPYSSRSDPMTGSNFQFYTQPGFRSRARGNPQSNPFGSDPAADALFRAFAKRYNINLSHVFQGQNPRYESNSFPSPSTDLPFKSIFVQPVKIPLEDLYKGAPSFRFELQDNLYTRYRASIRGNMIIFSLSQAFMFALPILRTSKLLAYIVGLGVIHGTTPIPNPSYSYTKQIQKGAKGGETSVKFAQSGQLEIVFDIEEAKHPVYRREGNDLYATVTITSKEAQNGCKKELEALDPSEKAIEIKIPRNKYSYKKQKQLRKRGLYDKVKIRNRGWPVRKNTESDAYSHGDLIVTIRVQKSAFKRR